MNILEILKESILLEAVRINNGREAYELIRNNKLGVKIHPSWKNEKEKHLIILMDAIIKLVGANDAVFAIQLAANKISADTNDLNNSIIDIDEETKMGVFPKLIKFRNRPWAKQVPEYVDFISLNNKPISFKSMESLLNKMNQEAQKHGHGDVKEVKTLYNDGTWTLQIPLSFKGAKAISFYGKKGEQQIPTEWCTRADRHWYDRYTSKYHLHVIRNWKTGKSYQMAFDGNRLDFLDQKDVKGDKISRGDLTALPNEMLSKFEFAKEFNLIDYKEKYNNAAKDKKAVLDKTTDPNEARWGEEIKIVENVYKREWLNWNRGDTLISYKVTNNVNLRRKGPRMFKYYFKDNPNIFITNGIDEDTTMWYTKSNGKIIELDDIEDDDLRDEIEETGETLEYYANQVNGTRKREEREDNLHDYLYGSEISENAVEREFQKDKQFKKSIEDCLSNKLNKKVEIRGIESGQSIAPGGIIPAVLIIEAKIDDEVIFLAFKNPDENHIKYSMKSYINSAYKKVGIDESIEERLEAMVSTEVKKIAKLLIKDKRLKVIRQAHKKDNPNRKYESGLRRMQLEDYFPY